MNKKYKIGGMTCEHCASNVKSVLEKIEGVNEATVDLQGNDAALCTQRDISFLEIQESLSSAGDYFLVERDDSDTFPGPETKIQEEGKLTHLINKIKKLFAPAP